MPLFKNVTVTVGGADVITAAEAQSAPVDLENKSGKQITCTSTGSTGDTYVIEPYQILRDVPGNGPMTATVASDPAQLVVHRGGISPSVKLFGTSPADPVYTSPVDAGLIGTEVVVNATGSGAIAATTASTKAFKLKSVTCHLDAGPTTSEDLTVTLDALDGSAYDTVLKRVDPSLVAAQDIVYLPDGDSLFEAGDQIAVDYTNTDGATFGLRIVIEEF